jgi:hypothetical protein
LGDVNNVGRGRGEEEGRVIAEGKEDERTYASKASISEGLSWTSGLAIYRKRA